MFSLLLDRCLAVRSQALLARAVDCCSGQRRGRRHSSLMENASVLCGGTRDLPDVSLWWPPAPGWWISLLLILLLLALLPRLLRWLAHIVSLTSQLLSPDSFSSISMANRPDYPKKGSASTGA